MTIENLISPDEEREASSQKSLKSSNRIMEEWKVNIELHKWHDNLKQTRFRYFISIQTAMLALIGLVMKEFLQSDHPAWMAVLFCFSAINFLYCKMAFHIDQRAADYVKAIKEKIRNLEKEWNTQNPGDEINTYEYQYQELNVKNTSTKTAVSLEKYQIIFSKYFWALICVVSFLFLLGTTTLHYVKIIEILGILHICT